MKVKDLLALMLPDTKGTQFFICGWLYEFPEDEIPKELEECTFTIDNPIVYGSKHGLVINVDLEENGLDQAEFYIRYRNFI